MNDPAWLTAINWSTPTTIEVLRRNRSLLPHASGVYVFTNFDGALERNLGVLYVGKARSLNSRVQSYLVDPAVMTVMSPRAGSNRVNTSLRHAGKALLLVEIQQKCRDGAPSNMWVRWASAAGPAVLERQLIDYFQPAFNTQGRSFDD